MEQNNGKEVWQTIGAIVGSLTGIVALILQLGKLVALVRRILKWSRGRWSMFRQWWHWTWHSPLFLITEPSSLRISKSDGSAEIEVTMSCQGRLKTNGKTIIEEGRIDLSIGHRIPKLYSNFNRLVLNHQELKQGIICQFRGSIHITPLANLEDSIKQIGSEVRCTIGVEHIWMDGLPGERSMNLKSFKAKVEYR